MVRSRMPGMVISGICSRPSKIDVLPDLVADRDRIELLAEPRQQFEVLARIDHRGGIERIVEQHRLGLAVEDASQRLLGQPPVRRLEAHQTRNAAGLADDRQIGVVDRLEARSTSSPGSTTARIALSALRCRPMSPSPRSWDRARGRASARNGRRSPAAVPECPSSTGIGCSRSSTASAAARRMSSGPGSSGKPWPRLMALLSRASCDIASKIGDRKVAQKPCSWTSSERSAAGLGRQPCGLPGQHAACEMLVVGQGRRPAPPATPSPSACRSGRQKPPACPADREYPQDRRSTAERRPRPDRLPPATSFGSRTSTRR